MKQISTAIIITLISLLIILAHIPKQVEVINHWPKKVITLAEVSAYSKAETCPDEECITASGKVATKGLIACPRAIPLGDKVVINGQEYECADRTHKRFDGRYDIWHENYDDAIEFGIQHLAVIHK